MKKTIRLNIAPIYLDYISISEAIQLLRELEAKYSSIFANLALDSVYEPYNDRAVLYLTGDRLETDEEEARRLHNFTLQEGNQRRLYESLKKKYEPDR